MTWAFGIGLLGTALALGLLVAFVARPGSPVGRARVARFARRQQLRITQDNGNQIITYLATTRRWRVVGVLAAVAGYAYVELVLGRDGPTVGVLQILSGWFVGALIAEVALARRPGGERRSAWLRPRDPAHYLSLPARLALPAALAVSLTLGMVTLVAGTTAGQDVDGRGALLAQLAALGIAAAVWTVRQRVLLRAQPADLPADRQAADDAIRSRSLHVLAGAGAALVLYAANYQLAALREPVAPVEAGMAVLALGAPVLGWLVATASWSVRRPSTAAAEYQPAA